MAKKKAAAAAAPPPEAPGAGSAGAEAAPGAELGPGRVDAEGVGAEGVGADDAAPPLGSDDDAGAPVGDEGDDDAAPADEGAEHGGRRNEGQDVARALATVKQMLADRGVKDPSLQGLSEQDVLNSSSRTVFSVDLPVCLHRILVDLNPKFAPKNIKNHLGPGKADAAPAAKPPRQKKDDRKQKPAAAAAAAEPEEAGEVAAAAAAFDPKVIILVVADPDGPNSQARKGLPDNVQVFTLKELAFNVSRHHLVPRHEAIRDEATKAAILKRYMLTSRNKLPLILSSDPQARYLALQPGDIVKITRPSPSAGTAVFYRACVKA